jgi:hypothetical protein
MAKKELLIGIIVGLIANALGVFLAATLLGKGDDIGTVVQAARSEGFFGKLVSLGAILNLIVFFIFIKKKQDFRARGVLMATILIAIFTFVIKL